VAGARIQCDCAVSLPHFTPQVRMYLAPRGCRSDASSRIKIAGWCSCALVVTSNAEGPADLSPRRFQPLALCPGPSPTLSASSQTSSTPRDTRRCQQDGWRPAVAVGRRFRRTSRQVHDPRRLCRHPICCAGLRAHHSFGCQLGCGRAGAAAAEAARQRGSGGDGAGGICFHSGQSLSDVQQQDDAYKLQHGVFGEGLDGTGVNEVRAWDNRCTQGTPPCVSVSPRASSSPSCPCSCCSAP
jgi:hypothetical protein